MVLTECHNIATVISLFHGVADKSSKLSSKEFVVIVNFVKCKCLFSFYICVLSSERIFTEMDERSSCILDIFTQLKERNVREHSFSEVISHSNRLLESLDFLQKENFNRKLQSIKSEDAPDSTHDSTSKTEEITMLMKCCSLQKDLAECHKKISDYAQNIIDFRNQLDEKDKLIDSQKSDLIQSQNSMIKYKDLCQSYSQQVESLKVTLQNKIDECDTLNITYSSLENKKNNLEIENKVLRNELLVYKNREIIPVLTENVERPADDKMERKLKRMSQPDMSKQVVGMTSKPCNKVVTQPSDFEIPVTTKFEFDAHDSEVTCVAWVPSSTQIITAGADRKVKLWHMSENSVVMKRSVCHCNNAIMSVDLDIEAGLLLCASCDFVNRVCTVNDFTVRQTFLGHSARVMSAKFLQADNQIVSGGVDQTLKLWDLKRTDCLQTWNTGSQVNDIVTKQGHIAISCHANCQVNIWDVRSNSLVANVHCSAGLTSLDISKNGHTLLVSQLDNKLALIDVRKFKETCSLFGTGFEIGFNYTRAKFSPDCKYCSCGSKNGSLYVWDVQSGTVIKELKGHSAPIIACSWSSCGSYIVSCDSKKKCVVWSN